MAPSVTQVVYRPESHPSQAHHPPEFLVYVDPAAYVQWVKDESVPLVDVLTTTKDIIWVLPHGQTGLRARPSNQELESYLGTSNHDEAAKFILRKGKVLNPSNGGDIVTRDRPDYVHGH